MPPDHALRAAEPNRNTADRFEDFISRTVAKFGPLTPEQIATISVLLELPTPDRSESDGEAA